MQMCLLVFKVSSLEKEIKSVKANTTLSDDSKQSIINDKQTKLNMYKDAINDLKKTGNAKIAHK